MIQRSNAARRVLDLARDEAALLGHRYLGPEQLHASVGLSQGYRGAAGPLLEALGVDPDRLREALLAEFGETVS